MSLNNTQNFINYLNNRGINYRHFIKYAVVIRFFEEFIDEVIQDKYLVDPEPSTFIKPRNSYKFSNLMRILFNEYKIEFCDDNERRIKDKTKALFVFKNIKKFIPFDIQRDITQNYL